MLRKISSLIDDNNLIGRISNSGMDKGIMNINIRRGNDFSFKVEKASINSTVLYKNNNSLHLK